MDLDSYFGHTRSRPQSPRRWLGIWGEENRETLVRGVATRQDLIFPNPNILPPLENSSTPGQLPTGCDALANESLTQSVTTMGSARSKIMAPCGFAAGGPGIHSPDALRRCERSRLFLISRARRATTSWASANPAANPRQRSPWPGVQDPVLQLSKRALLSTHSATACTWQSQDVWAAASGPWSKKRLAVNDPGASRQAPSGAIVANGSTGFERPRQRRHRRGLSLHAFIHCCTWVMRPVSGPPALCLFLWRAPRTMTVLASSASIVTIHAIVLPLPFLLTLPFLVMLRVMHQ